MKTIVSISANVPNASELQRHGVQQDHLDVEQDEQHRDEVEGDPEAEVLADVRRQAALVRVALRPRRGVAPERRSRAPS